MIEFFPYFAAMMVLVTLTVIVIAADVTYQMLASVTDDAKIHRISAICSALTVVFLFINLGIIGYAAWLYV